MEETIETMIN